ncbi:MAG: hypothetical protein WCV72_04960 [Patescibacteria group bacterium]
MGNPNNTTPEQVPVPEKNFEVFKGLKLMRKGVRNTDNVRRASSELKQGQQMPFFTLADFERVTTYLGQILQKLIAIDAKGETALPELNEKYGRVYGKMTGLGLDGVNYDDPELYTRMQRQNVRLKIMGITTPENDGYDSEGGFDDDFNPSINPNNNPLLATVRDLLIVLRSHNFVQALPILSQQEISDLVANLRGYLAEMEQKQEN